MPWREIAGGSHRSGCGTTLIGWASSASSSFSSRSRFSQRWSSRVRLRRRRRRSRRAARACGSGERPERAAGGSGRGVFGHLQMDRGIIVNAKFDVSNTLKHNRHQGTTKEMGTGSLTLLS
ncbi:uncharacterized protein A4U43_C10F3150 [Asparagus officinalis]|uniref:Uncharacterized protein n=1 Tax=Asparagus officinalis TaxID=4686 RepID=A0A5P1E0A9_ASPOF|nr:uncharacterized protein A4U43_C10F3150 [Asparagus officinalis]